MLDIDKLYYIMDYSGNYYRINDRNDLVIAKNTNEAAVFSFIEANKRINVGHKNKFYFMTPVEEEQEYQDDDELSVTGNFADAIISIANEVKKSSNIAETDVTAFDYDLSQIDWQEYLLHFTYVIETLAMYKDSLVKDQSDVDLKICDILHYIELCDTSSEEAVGLVNLLKECREHRRNVKDEIIRIDAFQRTVGTNANLIKAKEAIKCIKGLENRKYTPRKLSELFGGEIIEAQTKMNKTKTDYERGCTMIIEKDAMVRKDENMEMIHKETVFDGKDNDWMAFAMKQAEFYRDAKQYIVNIKLDICNIDAQISNLLNEIDTSNCNVAQGYKLFKRLKELRLQRNQKVQELECLHILTDGFDMSVMAEECEGNVSELEKILYPAQSMDAYKQDEEHICAEEVCMAV